MHLVRLKTLNDQTGSDKSKMVASKPEVPKSQPACRHDRNTILKAMFPIGHSKLLYDLTGSGIFKMAGSKPEVSIPRLENVIRKQLQRLCLCFWGRATWRDQWGYCYTRSKNNNIKGLNCGFNCIYILYMIFGFNLSHCFFGRLPPLGLWLTTKSLWLRQPTLSS